MKVQFRFIGTLCGFLLATIAAAGSGIHDAPIVLPAQSIKPAQYHPLAMYRVFVSSADGTATPIPFQIDERDNYTDFILPNGPMPNTKLSNGIFDFRDEISFMGGDVGPVQIPKKWPFAKPSVLYEVTFTKGDKKGAVYIGAYFSAPPPLATKQYVNFNLKNAEVTTSRYSYRFNNQNYLVVRGIDIFGPSGDKFHLLDGSTFFMKADLKYFLTFTINQNDINSELEAYKVGPIRTIARVNFNYKILKLNFDLGMYTEVSFFENSVILPAVIDNPLEGQKSLNKGSLFYYGFSLAENPKNINIDTNMPDYQEEASLLDLLKQKEKSKDHYWITASHPKFMFFLEMTPSRQMREVGNIPMFYKEETDLTELKKRQAGIAQGLGKSPVSLAMALDLSSMKAGVHDVGFRLFIENRNDREVLEQFKGLDRWVVQATRLLSTDF